MEAAFIIAMIVAIPVILFPAAFIWYMNIGGIYQAVKDARKAKAKEKATEATGTF
jgi:hypothetical protein